MNPLPSMVRTSLVPTTVEEEILNLPPSFMSAPIVQLKRKLPKEAIVLEAERVNCGELTAVEPALYMVN